MRTLMYTLGLVAFTFGMWGLFIWLLGEIGILLVVISGYAMPIWAWCILAALGVDDDPCDKSNVRSP